MWCFNAAAVFLIFDIFFFSNNFPHVTHRKNSEKGWLYSTRWWLLKMGKIHFFFLYHQQQNFFFLCNQCCLCVLGWFIFYSYNFFSLSAACQCMINEIERKYFSPSTSTTKESVLRSGFFSCNLTTHWLAESASSGTRWWRYLRCSLINDEKFQLHISKERELDSSGESICVVQFVIRYVTKDFSTWNRSRGKELTCFSEEQRGLDCCWQSSTCESRQQ